MKIATWNIERMKHIKQMSDIIQICEQVQADILVLTETDTRVNLGYRNVLFTESPLDIMLPQYREPIRYQPTERRVAIYTNYPIVGRHITFDDQTALCVELETEGGPLVVYGTIMGVLGNRHSSYKQDLNKQLTDIHRLTVDGTDVCICGDFNCSFSDSFYFTEDARASILETFSECSINLLTRKQAMCIDHIAVSKRLLTGAAAWIEEWNHDLKLSDHRGISVTIQ